MDLNKEDLQAIAQEVYNLQKQEQSEGQGASVGANNRARTKNEREANKTNSNPTNWKLVSKIGLFSVFLMGDLILLAYLLPYLTR